MDREDLTERRKELLKAITEEYIETGEPVGSQNLVEKYNFKVSPATVRNEMAALTEMGYLTQPHTSAGRQPTNIGLRYFLENLMEKVELPVLQEVALKQRVWQDRFEISKMLSSAAAALSDVVGTLVVISLEDGRSASSGAVKVLDYSEFFDIDVTRAVLHLIDHIDLLRELKQKGAGEADAGYRILLGEEIGLSNLQACGMVFSEFLTKENQKGMIAVVGPIRMNFPQVLPAVKFSAQLLSEIGGSW